MFDHRIMVRDDGRGGTWLTIHEVYYDDNHRILAWTVEPVGPVGEDLEDLRMGHRLIGTALEKPALEMRGEDLYENGELVFDHTAPHPWDAMAERIQRAIDRRATRL